MKTAAVIDAYIECQWLVLTIECFKGSIKYA